MKSLVKFLNESQHFLVNKHSSNVEYRDLQYIQNKFEKFLYDTINDGVIPEPISSESSVWEGEKFTTEFFKLTTNLNAVKLAKKLSNKIPNTKIVHTKNFILVNYVDDKYQIEIFKIKFTASHIYIYKEIREKV